MSEMRYKYCVALSESTNADDLEELLNEKASEGYELFMLHEVDNRMGKPQYNCIFYKIDEVPDSNDGENVEIIDITDFQKQMEKMYNTDATHKEYIDTQQKIINTQKQIGETKAALEVASEEKERNLLNEQISEKINVLNQLQKQLAKITDSYRLYDRIKSDKITVYLSDELICMTEKSTDENLVARNIKLRQDLTDKYAYVIPNIRYSDGATLEPYQYRIDIREVPAATGYVYPGHRMLYKGQSNITRKPKNSISGVDPIYFFDVYWVKEEETRDYWEKGSTASDVIAQHLAISCLKLSNELLDYKDINKYIDIVRKENFELAENVVPEVISMGDLRFVIASLIREMIPVKDVTFLFEKIMDFYNYSAEKDLLLEKLRISLKRQICHSRADETSNLYTIIVDPALDKYLIDQTVTPEHTRPFIDLPDTETEQLISAAVKYVEKAKMKIENTVILCSSELRYALAGFVEDYIPGISVISYEEVANEVTLEEIGTLTRRHITSTQRKK